MAICTVLVAPTLTALTARLIRVRSAPAGYTSTMAFAFLTPFAVTVTALIARMTSRPGVWSANAGSFSTARALA